MKSELRIYFGLGDLLVFEVSANIECRYIRALTT